ncbi:unnamed protein product [Linum trigynum]|uniref:Secreted protein n=1 Tax=Linum trigynum TaxID=586398 RepID=A0AAV2CVW8_9ROSI
MEHSCTLRVFLFWPRLLIWLHPSAIMTMPGLLHRYRGAGPTFSARPKSSLWRVTTPISCPVSTERGKLTATPTTWTRSSWPNKFSSSLVQVGFTLPLISWRGLRMIMMLSDLECHAWHRTTIPPLCPP